MATLSKTPHFLLFPTISFRQSRSLLPRPILLYHRHHFVFVETPLTIHQFRRIISSAKICRLTLPYPCSRYKVWQGTNTFRNVFNRFLLTTFSNFAYLRLYIFLPR